MLSNAPHKVTLTERERTVNRACNFAFRFCTPFPLAVEIKQNQGAQDSNRLYTIQMWCKTTSVLTQNKPEFLAENIGGNIDRLLCTSSKNAVQVKDFNKYSKLAVEEELKKMTKNERR